MSDATTAAPTTTTDGVAAPAAAPAAPWHGVTDPDAAAYIDNKGWKSAADVVKSYQGAEKLIGRDPNSLVQVPRADDPAGFRAVMAKLGLPETADKYEFAKVEGVTPDESYTAWARGTFHELGLTSAQVKALTAKHGEFVKGTLAEQAKAYDAAVQLQKSELVKEWGGGHERMMNAAQTSAKALGFTAPMIDAIEKAVGYKDTYKFFANIGAKMGEDTFVTGDMKNGFNGTLTPEQARAEIEAIKLDPVKKAALFDPAHASHKSVKSRYTDLFKLAYPE